MTIYTIGYGNQAPEAFFARIPANALLIDVRYTPYSSHAQEYSAVALSKRFGRRYLHCQVLGNMYHKPRTWCPPSKTVALGTLYGIAKKMAKDHQSVCFMCTEGKSDICHRVLVAEALERMMPGVQLVHL